MDLFSKEFIILLVASFVSYYLLYLINRLAKKTIIPQWVVLLIASLVFYGFNNYVYLIYLGFSFIVTYLTSLLTQYKLFNKDSSNKTKFHPLKIDKSTSGNSRGGNKGGQERERGNNNNANSMAKAKKTGGIIAATENKVTTYFDSDDNDNNDDDE